MRALSIRQPYAELILRGIKRVEFRSRPTRIVGERFHIYAGRQWAAGKLYLGGCEGRAEFRDMVVDPAGEEATLATGEPAAWRAELARMLALRDLPTGVIVGSAVIERVSPPVRGDGMYRWHLTGVERAGRLRKPRGHPQPVWFEPFGKAVGKAA